MGQIYLQFDNKLEHDEIIIPLTNSSPEEAGSNYVYNKSGLQQTSVYGVLTPIIKINNITISFYDVNYLSLSSTKATPEISFSIKDSRDLIKRIGTPGNDNNIQIQILPPFDNAYKKINMDFYITNINIKGDEIVGSGRYKLPKLTNTQYKCFGEISTYDLMESIAIETGLGFATNVDHDMNDTRLIYCNNKSYLEILNKEIKFSNSDQTHVYNYWIDFWNNLTLVDIYDRYNTIEKEEDMQVWVSGQPNEMTEGIKHNPMQITAILSNNPVTSNTELFVESYEIINKPRSQVSKGSDKVLTSYNDSKGCFEEVLIQDGNVKKDVFLKYDYIGECYSDYNYLLAERKREAYMQKLNTESVKVVLKTPLLGLMRGEKVEFAWYTNDTDSDNKINSLKSVNTEKHMLFNDNVQVIGNLSGLDNDSQSSLGAVDTFKLDKSISGQYMISSQNIIYNNGEWEYELILNRPAWHKPNFFNEELINNKNNEH